MIEKNGDFVKEKQESQNENIITIHVEKDVKKRDIFLRDFIENEQYDIYDIEEINETLPYIENGNVRYRTMAYKLVNRQGGIFYIATNQKELELFALDGTKIKNVNKTFLNQNGLIPVFAIQDLDNIVIVYNKPMENISKSEKKPKEISKNVYEITGTFLIVSISLELGTSKTVIYDTLYEKIYLALNQENGEHSLVVLFPFGRNEDFDNQCENEYTFGLLFKKLRKSKKESEEESKQNVTSNNVLFPIPEIEIIKLSSGVKIQQQNNLKIDMRIKDKIACDLEKLIKKK